MDIAIVATYAYTLFQVEPGADVRYLLLGYVIVFAFYLASGLLRIVRFGSDASRIQPIVTFLAVSAAIFGIYVLLAATTGVNLVALNCVALLSGWSAMYGYRWYRHAWRDRRA